MQYFCTAHDLAQIAGVDRRTIINWLRDAPHTLPPVAAIVGPRKAAAWRPEDVKEWAKNPPKKYQYQK